MQGLAYDHLSQDIGKVQNLHYSQTRLPIIARESKHTMFQMKHESPERLALQRLRDVVSPRQLHLFTAGFNLSC